MANKKDAFYFSHDYEPTNDPKIQAMMADYGGLGYGMFWRIIEMLHSDSAHQLPFKKYLYAAIAKQLSANGNNCSTKMNKIKQPDISAEQVEIFIQDCIRDYELFSSDEDFFWSERVWRNIEAREDISAKRSLSGKKSAEARRLKALAQQNPAIAEQVLTSVEQNPTKERKVKEKKVKENTESVGQVEPPETPTSHTVVAGSGTYVVNGGRFEFDEAAELPATFLESAELNQFTLYKNKNTDFLLGQWKVFLHERRKANAYYPSLSKLADHFVNWVRTKHPPRNGNLTKAKTSHYHNEASHEFFNNLTD
jgi:hypothetical protein